MTKVSSRQAAKTSVRATMFHVATPPCTASILNTRINTPAEVNVPLYSFKDYFSSVSSTLLLNQSAPCGYPPMTEVQTLTVKPDSVDGSGLSGKRTVLKLSLSSIPGRMSILGVLTLSLSSTSSWADVRSYTRLGCSGWYLTQA